MNKSAKSIIIEEYNKLINEYDQSNKNTFQFKDAIEYDTTQFEEIQVLKPEVEWDNLGITTSNITISWIANFSVGSSGIENFTIQVNGLDGSFILETYDENSGDIVDQNEISIGDFEWNFDIDSDTAVIKLGQSLYIKGAIFNFKTKNCYIFFYD